MGLERTVCVLNGFKSVYDIDLFQGAFAKIEELSGKKYNSDPRTMRAMRIIADHVRTSTFLLGDPVGVVPSNVDQGYVLRRLIRRAVRMANSLGMPKGSIAEIAKVYIDVYKDVYPELTQNHDKIIDELNKEEDKFSKTLVAGEKEFTKVISHIQGNVVPGGTITYGKLYESLPFDNVVYIAEVTGTNLITLARNNYFWRVSGEKVVNDAKHVYKIAIIDYVLLHQNSNRMYDRAASAFESGRMKPIALTKADGSKYNYREMTRDYILKVGTINSDDYNGKNVFTNRDILTKDVTITASLSEVAPVQYCLAASFVGKNDYVA